MTNSAYDTGQHICEPVILIQKYTNHLLHMMFFQLYIVEPQKQGGCLTIASVLTTETE